MRAKELMDVEQNISKKERVISLLSGSYLLYKALAKEDKSIVKAFTAGYLVFRGATGYCPMNSAIGIDEVETTNDVNIKTSITVNKPREQVYDFWRKLENLPTFMDHLHKVTALDGKTSKWEAKVPGGIGTITWQSEIVEDVPGEFISWISLPNSSIENVGSVRFTDAGEFGTEINADITYRAPLGAPGKRVAKMINPMLETMVKEDIKDFKRVIETGQIPATNGHYSE